MKVLVRIGLVCAALFVVGALGITACVVHVANDSGWSMGFWNGTWNHKAERSETHELALAAGGELTVDVRAGEVRVRSSETDKPTVVAHITAWGKNDEEAKELLDQTKLDIVASANGVSIRYSTVSETSLRAQPSVDLDVVVPARARLSIETGSGAIRADGDGFTDARLTSSYGAVSISRVAGNLTATSNSGDVRINDVHGKRCEVRSGYGALSLARVEVEELVGATKSGAIAASALKARSTKLESGYGDLELADVDGELSAKSSSGAIRAKRLRNGPFTLASNYGTVAVADAHGMVTAKSSSGDIDISSVEGAVVAETKYGAVRVEGVLTGLEAHTSSGAMSIRALGESQLAGDWKIGSNYGDVHCELPRELAFELAAKTGYGDIDLGYDIVVTAGGLKSGKQIAGKVNGGGHRLEVTTSNGNIKIDPAEAR